jgi:pimeloyl-ACP methyl ester carboxylesterase
MNSKIYILLHGAWHASWCWHSIIPGLTAKGHTVIAPDLPGHGDDQTPFADITLQTYLDFIGDIIAAQQAPVVLVGHSMAGVIMSQLAENMPEKIEQLIYVAAFIPVSGESLLQEAKKAQTPGVSSEMVLDKEHYSMNLRRSERLKTLFYAHCAPADAEYAMQQLREEPSRPFIEPIIYSAQRFGQVNKRYIACLRDQVITSQDQQRMYARVTRDVIELNTDHSPFFSMPQALVAAL